jgi:hypothetical protein
MTAPIDKLLEEVAWEPTGAADSEGLPYATHSGVFEFAGMKLRCYRLSDGRAVFNADDFKAAFCDLLEGLA